GEASDQIERSLDGYRDARDQSSERLFKGIYESPWLAAWVGLDEKPSAHRSRQSQSWEHQELQRLKREAAEAHIAQGTPLDAWLRMVIYTAREEHVIDERPFNLARRMIEELAPQDRPTLGEAKAAVKRQAFVVCLDEERAIAALPKLLPETAQRRRALDAARRV